MQKQQKLSIFYKPPLLPLWKNAQSWTKSIFTSILQSLLLFTSVVMDSAGIDYHVMLAANAIQQCLDIPDLQPELLCALIKQTSRPTTHAKHGVQVKRNHSNRQTRVSFIFLIFRSFCSILSSFSWNSRLLFWFNLKFLFHLWFIF